MYYVKPLMAEDVHYVASIMSETNNVTALHSTNHPLEEWKCIFEKNSCDTDEENFLICVDNDVCAWLKLNGLLNKDVAWISMLQTLLKQRKQKEPRSRKDLVLFFMTGALLLNNLIRDYSRFHIIVF